MIRKYQSKNLNSSKKKLLLVSIFVVIAGCSSTKEFDKVTPEWDRSTRLELPPDLSAPSIKTNDSQESAAFLNASKSELQQYEKFEKFQQMADFQDFLAWREEHSTKLDLTIESFRQSKNKEILRNLSKKGVLNIKTRDGNEIVLINDTLENSWDRLLIASESIALDILSVNKKERLIRFQSLTKNDKSKSSWLNRITQRKDYPIYNMRLEQTQNGPAVIISNDGDSSLTKEHANTLIKKITVELLTFSNNDLENQIKIPEKPTAVILEESSSGHVNIIVNSPVDTVWAILDRQLRDFGFSITESNDKSLRFTLRYDDPSMIVEKDFLQSLAFWKDEINAPPQDIYLVLTPINNKTRIDAVNENNQQSKIGDKVLQLISKGLQLNDIE